MWRDAVAERLSCDRDDGVAAVRSREDAIAASTKSSSSFLTLSQHLALASALVDVPRRVVVNPQHGHDAVRRAVGAADVGVRRPDVVDAQADAARVLRDARTSFQSIINALNTIFLHREQEAGRELGPRRARVEERRRRVREVLLGHQFISFDGGVDLCVRSHSKSE